MTKARPREIELYEPPPDAVYTIEATSQLVDIPRHTILVYCKHRLVMPVIDARNRGYFFDREGIRTLRRIEALRVVCGDHFAGIRIILDLTKELERLQAAVRFQSQNEGKPKPRAHSQWNYKTARRMGQTQNSTKERK